MARLRNRGIPGAIVGRCTTAPVSAAASSFHGGGSMIISGLEVQFVPDRPARSARSPSEIPSSWLRALVSVWPARTRILNRRARRLRSSAHEEFLVRSP
jgi:hypothetical protein